MKHVRTLILLSVLFFAVSGIAQTAAPATPAPQAQAAPQPQQPPPTIASVVDRQISGYEKLVVDVAEAMPEDKYNFTPDSLGIKGASYSGVRTFAQLIKHTAFANFRYWSAVSGDPLPDNVKNAKGSNGPDELTTKAQIVQFLKDSFAVGHRAAKTLTSENVVEMIPVGQGKQPRLYLATGAVIHNADEYGQMVEYLRMNGITPPASAPR
ncbi:MAG TPA: DinB family protein [Alphaproteobacteria bacterium]|nr:DinB family protein [Alphaproteobacteria bacterium]